MAYSQSDKDRQKKIGKFIKEYPAWVYILESSFKTPDLVINEGGFLIFKTEVSNLANIIYGEGQLLQIGEKLSAYNWLNPGENSPAQASSFKPNAYGLYNISGNVAEFVKAEIGANYFTKGGSWGDPGYYLQINTKQTYDVNKSASPFRGFRPILKMEF